MLVINLAATFSCRLLFVFTYKLLAMLTAVFKHLCFVKQEMISNLMTKMHEMKTNLAGSEASNMTLKSELENYRQELEELKREQEATSVELASAVQGLANMRDTYETELERKNFEVEITLFPSHFFFGLFLSTQILHPYCAVRHHIEPTVYFAMCPYPRPTSLSHQGWECMLSYLLYQSSLLCFSCLAYKTVVSHLDGISK